MGDYEPIILPFELEDESHGQNHKRNDKEHHKGPKDRKPRVFAASTPSSNNKKKRKNIEEPKPREFHKERARIAPKKPIPSHTPPTPLPAAISIPSVDINAGVSGPQYDQTIDGMEPVKSGNCIGCSVFLFFLLFVGAAAVLVLLVLKAMKIIDVFPTFFNDNKETYFSPYQTENKL